MADKARLFCIGFAKAFCFLMAWAVGMAALFGAIYLAIEHVWLVPVFLVLIICTAAGFHEADGR